MESKKNDKEEMKQNVFLGLSEKLGEISPKTRIEFDSSTGEEQQQEEQQQEEQRQEEQQQEDSVNADSSEETDDDEIYALLTGKVNLDETEDTTADKEEADSSDDKQDEAASIGLKAAGIATICLAVLGLASIGVMLYFLVINPVYLKKGTDKNFDIPYVTTGTDGINMSDVVLLQTPSDVNLDEIKDNVADIDANAVDNSTVTSTPTDATPTDATPTDT